MKLRRLLIFFATVATLGVVAWIVRPKAPELRFVRSFQPAPGSFYSVYRIENHSDSSYWLETEFGEPSIYLLKETSGELIPTRWADSSMDETALALPRVETIPPHSSFEFNAWSGNGNESFERYKIGVRVRRGTRGYAQRPNWLMDMEEFYSNLALKVGRPDWDPNYIWSGLVPCPKIKK